MNVLFLSILAFFHVEVDDDDIEKIPKNNITLNSNDSNCQYEMPFLHPMMIFFFYSCKATSFNSQ